MGVDPEVPVPLKDRMQFLTTPEQVDAFVKDHPSAAIFKAGTCHKTNETFTYVQAKLEPRDDLPLGIIRVVEARTASNRVEEITGIQHESPQIVLFKDGKAVFDRDNWDITAESLAEALDAHFTRVA
jgi:bacillithiol system protein YtxJ